MNLICTLVSSVAPGTPEINTVYTLPCGHQAGGRDLGIITFVFHTGREQNCRGCYHSSSHNTAAEDQRDLLHIQLYILDLIKLVTAKQEEWLYGSYGGKDDSKISQHVLFIL